jgi:hypothetical protein
MEDLSDLDHRMFARHPGGYLCRCGQADNGKPQHCTCMTDFPEATLSDLSARIEELERFVQRFIDLGYESTDHTDLHDLHAEAVALLPERR